MTRVPEVLLVDDNPADAALAREALEQSPYPCRVRETVNGDEALALLRRQGRFADSALPDVVILDLNLPKRSGEVVLSELRSDPSLRQIPVVVFSTSRSNRDIVRCYQLGANCYLSKPGNLKDFLSTVQMIGEYFGSRGATLRGE